MGSATRTATQQIFQEAEGLNRSSELELAAELFLAQQALGSSGQLLSFLADASAEENQKRALLEKLFPSFDARASKLLLSVVSAQWSKNSDILAALEELGITLAAGDTSTQVVDELYSLAEVVSTDAALELALNDKLAQSEAKAELVDRIFGKQLSPATVAIAKQLVAFPRGRRFTKLIDEATRTLAQHGGFRIAKVTVAQALDASKIAEIETELTASQGSPVKAIQQIQPDAVGGIRVQIGHEVLDGTIAARLHELRLQLA